MRISRTQLLTIIKSALDASPKLASTAAPAILSLSDEQRDELLRWVRAATTPQRVVTRSTIVLLAGAGWSPSQIAASVGVTRRTAALWCERFAHAGARALVVDAPGRGRKPGRDTDTIRRVLALIAAPPHDGMRWTVRSLARAAGVSHATVHRVLTESRPDQKRRIS